MAETVYLICAITSIVCAGMLFGAYRKNRGPLLFWSSLCFVGLAVNNILLVVDLVLLPQIDLSLWRSGVALVAMVMLLYGLIWKSM